MFPQSSQSKYWTFDSPKHLEEIKIENNRKYIEKHGSAMSPEQQSAFFLTPAEERLYITQWEIYLRDFSVRFEPQMPKCVVGTAFHYFKRFYVNNTPMDFHPKEILATCVYLACKVEEFNVSIGQFVSNIRGDRAKAINIILSNELLLMQQLNFYLTIHNPYKPVEGLLMDIRLRTNMPNPERLRPHIDEFLEKSFLTDACLLYPPSQIALSAVLHAAACQEENLDSFVTDTLFHGARNKLPSLIQDVRKIRSMVKNYQPPSKEAIRPIDKKLEQCRNQENNPDSEVYKARMRKMTEDDDDLMANTSYHLTDPNADTSMVTLVQ